MTKQPNNSAKNGNDTASTTPLITPSTVPHPEFGIQRIYTKDISFESPNTPAIYKENWQPQLNLNLQTTTTHLEGDDYEVVLKVTVTSTSHEKTAFLAEVQQAGIFTVKSFPAEQLQPLLSASCPNILFPYAREVIASLVTHGGFPQLNLAPINFDALYIEHMKQQQAAAQKDTTSGTKEETTGA